MAGYFSGMYNSVKNYMGWDNLETVSNGEEVRQETNVDERRGLFKQLSSLVGKDITSSISLPVWIFEPLSFLQILCDPMQYAELLDKASEDQDAAMRLAYLIAFVIAGHNCAIRTKKPFNPILGETFEFVSSDWEFLGEQVSHHPPVGVAEARSKKWRLLLEMGLRTKFTGNASDVFVDGSNHFYIASTNEHISWNHLNSCAHNVLIGGMWVDHFGQLKFVNHTNKLTATVDVTKAGWLGVGRYQFTGAIFGANGETLLNISGMWNNHMDVSKSEEKIRVWTQNAPIVNTRWNWSEFTQNLNEMSEEYEKSLPPTDSRLRADRRALQLEDTSTAGAEKNRLEEKQRAERKAREAQTIEYSPRNFQKIEDKEFGDKWEYSGNYWEERSKIPGAKFLDLGK